MSAIAGKLATQIGTHLLHRPQGGKGVLLGGLAGTPRGKVVVLGAGIAGQAAISVAAALGAEVMVFDKRPDRLAAAQAFGQNVQTRYAYADLIHSEVSQADLVIGAVLIPGKRAPQVVSRETVAAMQAGSVIVDISVDQGGCIATTHPTTYADPSYVESDVTHFAVTNMPAAAPRSASQALSAAIAPYVQRLTQAHWEEMPELDQGVNILVGKVVHPALL
jgi:alanine dehydrogenase